MKKTLLIFCVCAVQLCLLACSSDKTPRTIRVSGTGTVSVVSDRAELSLSVITRNRDVAAASAENAAIMTAVQSALTALGQPQESLTTGSYNVSEERSSVDGRLVRGEYRVSNELMVSINDTAAVGPLIDAALGAGANELSSLRFSSSQSESALDQARELAMQQAESAARLLAEAAGASLGEVLSIEEGGSYMPRYNKAVPMAMYADAAPTPVSAGNSEISTTLTVTWKLK